MIFRHQKTRGGFALVLVLLVLVLAGSYLGLAAHRSGQAALAAASAEEELQLKWICLSANAVARPALERILNEQQKEIDEPLATARLDMVLGNMNLTLILGDEQAKANANMLLECRGMQGLIDSLRQLQAGQRMALAVEPRPAAAGPENLISRWPQKFSSLEELFAPHSPLVILDNPGENGPAQRISCWGSGMVNIMRADALVLRTMVGELLTEREIYRIMKWRLDNPQGSVESALADAEIEKERHEPLRRLLTSRSSCHSIWIIISCGSRRWQRLYVNQQGDPGNDAQEWTFLW